MLFHLIAICFSARFLALAFSSRPRASFFLHGSISERYDWALSQSMDARAIYHAAPMIIHPFLAVLEEHVNVSMSSTEIFEAFEDAYADYDLNYLNGYPIFL